MSIDERLVCIAAGDSQIPLIKAAKEMGCKIIAIDRNPEAPGFSYVDERMIISTYETQRVLEKLSPLHDKYRLVGVVSRASGLALHTAAAIAETFHLPGLSRQIVPLAVQKSELREFCETNAFNMAKGQKLKLIEEIDLTLNIPLIIKPDIPIVGKENVRIIWKYSDLRPALKSACQTSANGFAEVEEFIDGFDIACLFLLKDGKMEMISCVDELVGIKKDGQIIGLGASAPSVISGTDVEKRVKVIISQFASHFINVNALLLICFRIDMSGIPYIIELHADLGGDVFADIMSAKVTTNFDYFGLAVKVATNQEIEVNNLELKPTCLLSDADNYEKDMLSDMELFHDRVVIQRGTPLANLLLASLLLAGSNNSLLYLPLHKQWLEQSLI